MWKARQASVQAVGQAWLLCDRDLAPGSYAICATGISHSGAATAPALIIVGFLMLSMIKDIPWEKFEEALPAFLTIVAMIFTLAYRKVSALDSYPIV